MKKNQGSLEKWLIPGLGWGIYKLSLELLYLSKTTGVILRDTEPTLRSSHWPKLGKPETRKIC